MSRSYRRKASRSKRKVQMLPRDAVSVETADGRAAFQMVLPLSEVLGELAEQVEKTAAQAGLLMMKALIEEEVEQLAGPRYAHQAERQARRWGQAEGHVIFAGRKVALKRPRVRGVGPAGAGEIPLSRYQAFAGPDRLAQSVQAKVLRRVSQRDYAGVLEEVCDGYGIDKSSVSRHWKAASTRQLRDLLERDLRDLDVVVVLLDGKEFHDYTLITALGVDAEGRKHVLGLWPGATENSEVCGMLLDDLIERGLSPQKRYLFVLDGSKALRKAVKARFGDQALIQRCRIHKERNIKAHLPPAYHRELARRLHAAWEMTDYAAAKKALKKVHGWLATINIAAAHSLEEGLEETLTVNQLKLPPALRKVFASTNLIENAFSRTADLCRNVKRWRDANMAWRWAGTALREAQQRFRRLKGYRLLPALLNALNRNLEGKRHVA